MIPCDMSCDNDIIDKSSSYSLYGVLTILMAYAINVMVFMVTGGTYHQRRLHGRSIGNY